MPHTFNLMIIYIIMSSWPTYTRVRIYTHKHNSKYIQI